MSQALSILSGPVQVSLQMSADALVSSTGLLQKKCEDFVDFVEGASGVGRAKSFPRHKSQDENDNHNTNAYYI